ncbi:type II toxin-antitoxin system prevent-host-death family antitoxin [Scytonema sp. UIC 10036]|uniref:type II toxin-antitoxin system Phd/YefM family antitoxin n=1 Tax=Scytonema sp. UIC 10036 TaxID=2304196 RepID=UPI0012DA447B|nr:type II toxin-antitoxin system Phd/YefM family antitoxin [Scytonema sp. UIC 10036]MUG97250.1 type II toxin-antitoxin system prevent-host-death family antitoxin [Scytonema sp. UIC 10036]
MTVISASDARANFQEIINRVEYGGERILIQRHGKTAVAVIGLEDLKRLEALEDAIDSDELRRAVEENDGFTTLESIIASRGNE